MGRSRVLTLTVVAALATLSTPVRAADPSLGTLQTVDDVLAFSGAFAPIVTPAVVEQCAVATCDRYVLVVDLPVGADQGTSVEVAVRWPSESTDTDLELYVTDASGATVGSSTGLDSSAEVVHLPTRNGVYDVWVAPSTLTEALTYEGRVEIERAPQVEPLRELLPNMTTLEPHTLRIGTGEYYVDPVRNDVVSCYPEETTDPDERIPTRCLRFDQIAYNDGAGPLELRFAPLDPASGGSPALRQRVVSSDGTWRERIAESQMEFHAIHGHWHYSGFGLGALFVDGDAQPVRVSQKKGFCLIDVDFEAWGAKGNGPRRNSAPGCLAPDPDQGGDVVMGITNGWADVYNWFLADQFIDITGLPDGVYRLEITADPNDTLLESDETDNASSTWICISGNAVAKVAGPSAAC